MSLKDSWILAAKAVTLGGMGGVFVLGKFINSLRNKENELIDTKNAGKEAEQTLKRMGLDRGDYQQITLDKMEAEVRSIRDNLLAHLTHDEFHHYFLFEQEITYAQETAEYLGYKVEKLYEGDQVPENQNAFLITKVDKNNKIVYEKRFKLQLFKSGNGLKPLFIIR